MRTNIVFVFLGDDRPGLVDQVSKVVDDHDGNWLESRLNRLAGKFAGIIQIGVEQTKAASLIEALESLSSSGLSVLCEQSDDGAELGPNKSLMLQVLGLDRRTIVHEISHALLTQRINVAELSTEVYAAPMTGELMFSAEVIIEVHEGADLDLLEDQLDLISRELSVDIELLPEQD